MTFKNFEFCVTRLDIEMKPTHFIFNYSHKLFIILNLLFIYCAFIANNDAMPIIFDRLIDEELAVIFFHKKPTFFRKKECLHFTKGRQIKIDGYFGKLNPYQAVANTRRLKGLPYSLKNFNCKHFVRVVHGVRKEVHSYRFGELLLVWQGAIVLFG